MIPCSTACLQFDIGVGRAFSSEIANGGEAGHQGVAQMVHRARHAQRQPFLGHLIVPDGLAVSVQENVRVAFDEARQQSGIGKLDDFRIRQADAGGGTGGFDPLAGDADGPSLVNRVPIKNAGRLQNDTRLGQPE